MFINNSSRPDTYSVVEDEHENSCINIHYLEAFSTMGKALDDIVEYEIQS